MPNIKGYNTEETYLEIYNASGTEITKEIKLSEVIEGDKISESKLNAKLAEEMK